MRQSFHELVIATRGRGLVEFTGVVAQWIAENNFRDGLVTLHLRHTSASLLIQENADPDVRRDLDAFFARLVCDGGEPFPAAARRPAGAGDLAGDLFVGTPHAPAFPPRGVALHRSMSRLQSSCETISVRPFMAGMPISGR
jgi:hypothetical protein